MMMMIDKVPLRSMTCNAADVAGGLAVAAITIIGTAVIKISLAVSRNDH